MITTNNPLHDNAISSKFTFKAKTLGGNLYCGLNKTFAHNSFSIDHDLKSQDKSSDRLMNDAAS